MSVSATCLLCDVFMIFLYLQVTADADGYGLTFVGIGTYEVPVLA